METYNKPIIVLKFFSLTCKPCRVYAPNFEHVVNKLGVDHISIDIDEHPDLKEHFNITNIPATVIIDDNGEVIASRQGALLGRDLTALIEGARANA